MTESKTIFFWDMDGVLLDSLGLDLQVVNPMLEERYGTGHTVSREFIRRKFALAIPEFIRDILMEVNRFTEEEWQVMVAWYEQVRREATFPLCPDAARCLEEVKASGCPQWVVSNTKERDLEAILSQTGIRPYFERLWGYDSHPNSARKPAPDIYLSAFEAAYQLHPTAERFVVCEDSVLGITSALEARRLWTFTTVEVNAVATGTDDAQDLQKADRVLATLKDFKL